MKPKRRNMLLSYAFICLFLAFLPVSGEAFEVLRGHGATGLLFAATPERATGGESVPVSVPIDLSNGIPVVEVRINERGPFPVALTTASRKIRLSAELVERLGLPGMKSATAGGAAGSDGDEERLVKIDSLHLGSLGFSNLPAVVTDASNHVEGEGAPVGMLGLPLFADYLTTVDFANETLALEKGKLPRADGRRILDYKLGAKESLSVPLQVGDLTVDAVLDPSLPASIVLHSRYIEKLSLGSEPRMIGRSINEDGEFPLLSARFDGAIRLGGQDLEQNSLRFFDIVSDGGIGGNVLREFSLTFDQRTQRVRVRRNDGFARQMQLKAATVGSLSEDGNDLRTAFNYDLEKVRMLLILSPT